MRVENRAEGLKPGMAAGMVCAAAWMFAATSGLAQERTGVSRPDPTPITADSGDAVSADTPAATPAAKPSAAIPATGAAATVYGPYVPYRAPGADRSNTGDAQSFDPDANIVTEATAGRADRRLLSDPGMAKGDADPGDLDRGIVTYVPSRPGEIPEGSLVRVRLREALSTLSTRPGTKFTAEVSEPVMRDGRVIVPAGSTMEGRVTWVRGGKRIGGAAAIHLEPRTVTLPDGAQYVLRARAIDTDRWDAMKVDDEGTILRRENRKRNLGVLTLTTGSGLAAGAMIGGVPGAVIGAGVGAGVSTVVWLRQDRQAELPKDFGVVFSLTEPMSVTPASAEVAPVKVGAPGGE